MSRYAIAAFLLAVLSTPLVAQTPISGRSPPWVQPSGVPITGAAPPWAPPSPIAPPIIGLYPMTYQVTDQVLAYLKLATVPDDIIAKVAPLKGKVFSLAEFTAALEKQDLASKEWGQAIWFYAQVSVPRFIPVPSGQPLRGFYKMDAILVGADGRFPFDSGEYNLAGFAGNARIWGTFEMTLPTPYDSDPLNQPAYFVSFRAVCQKMMTGSQGPRCDMRCGR
jgi:hypothetical protein